MPSGKHAITINVPIEQVWEFVREMDNWAPLLTGYIHHAKINERQSRWDFTERIGLLKKKISLKVTITEWKEPTKVSFSLEGINENLTGEGYFLAESITREQTKMTGYLEMNAWGPLGGVLNSVMKNSLSKSGEELTESIADKLVQQMKN